MGEGSDDLSGSFEVRSRPGDREVLGCEEKGKPIPGKRRDRSGNIPDNPPDGAETAIS